MGISVKNHTEVLIFHTQICARASQICFMADANLRFASPRRVNAPEWGLVWKKQRETGQGNYLTTRWGR